MSTNEHLSELIRARDVEDFDRWALPSFDPEPEPQAEPEAEPEPEKPAAPSSGATHQPKTDVDINRSGSLFDL